MVQMVPEQLGQLQTSWQGADRRLSWPEGAGQAGQEPTGKVGGRAEQRVETQEPGRQQTGTK